MVRPACFAFNPQTAASNAFQSATSGDLEARVDDRATQELALREFDALAARLSPGA